MTMIQDVLSKEGVKKLKDARVIGIDIGSRGTKAVLLYDGRIDTEITASGVSSQKTSEKLIQKLLEKTDVKLSDISCIGATGYGRIALKFEDVHLETLTEITCHAMGGHLLNENTRTILDIGGQDSKAIKVDKESGRVIDFVMNDKCAAGTGRFLEKIAMILELDLDELGKCAMLSENPIDISSQCVVFAESEVVSLRAQGNKKEDIAAGIHLATARRVKNLLQRVGLSSTVLFTGGVSKNPGMCKAVEEVTGKKLGITRMDTVFAGALGAAAYAQEYTNEYNQNYGIFI